ncbi:MAG TPA: radical SAM protein [Actinobacteria bacterium]|nr:radical SAM protein [Actinomycetota bacterium]
MNILLVRPVTNKMPIIIPNLGLAYLSSQLKKHGHSVTILDCAKLNYGYKDFKNFLDSGNFDIAGFQLFTCDFSSVLKMAGIVKEVNSDIITIAGGPHISGLPEHTMKEIVNLDYGFYGEAEIGIVKFCEYISGKGKDKEKETTGKSDIPGLIFRKGDEILVNERNAIENLDSIDFPDWESIDPNTYPHAPHGTFTKSLPTAPIITSRGCPYSCTYCGVKSTTGRRLRMRSPENIISEIELLIKKYGVKEVHIEDDNFTFNRERVVEFCNLLLDKNIKINWACPNGVRLDTLDEELLKLMEKSGCYSFAVGIESGSPGILKDMRRQVTVEKMREKIMLIANTTKIKMTGFLMAGYPTETIEDIEKTIKFVNSLPLNRAQYSNFLPLPGTKIFDDLMEKGEIDLKSLSWDNFQDNAITYSPPGISLKQLHKILKSAFYRFYFRPRIIINLLKEIHSFNQFKFVLARFIDIFK